VTCDANDKHEYFSWQPKLIVEILSETTERYDRAEKFHHYRKLASLEEYVLVAQDTQRVEWYRRSNQWDLSLFTEGDKIVFTFVDFTVPIAEIYEGVPFD